MGAIVLAAVASCSTSNGAAEHRSTQVSPAVSSAGVPRPPHAGTFSLVVRTSRGDLPAAVAPISVSSHQPVDPPNHTPKQWNTAAWVIQAAYPSAPSTGTTYVYGHACHHHVCPFTKLKDATVGDPIVVTTPAGVLNYQINRIGLSPRSARSLPAWASDSTITNRIVLVTCQYEQGDISINNIVVAATLTSAVPRAAP
jgi:hypothetical protein